MRESAMQLADCLEEVVAVQERLLTKLVAQRPAIIEGRHADLESLSQQTEIEVRRLAVAERVRAAAAQVLADERGATGTRWSLLRAGLDEDELVELDSLVGRVEQLVRDLEMANAINGQLVRQELEVLDTSMRSLAGSGPRAYTSAGSTAASPPPDPMMLNTAA